MLVSSSKLRNGSSHPCATHELVGLDRAAVQESFNEFVSGSNVSADQLHFIQQVIDYLTANGAMEISALYQSPLNDNGTPGAIIGDDRLDVVVDILDESRRRATPVPNSTPVLLPQARKVASRLD